ncbi:hypothetical protein A3860_13710 [Niastella vici]|uniref:Secretion system C-terminal sorting domain-containing protein n=1 Tax=Niastella vici TaxID=1703345 RepID=A0A1V9G7C0_9BACT|nr:SBBP repeat-containing protein [Niastella vici]OQP66535.1 hypothetical protein A3860_13710 [Niastella vici]
MKKNEFLKMSLLIIFIFLVPVLCFAQFKEEWVTKDIVGNDIAVDDNGNVYVTGFTAGTATGSDYATVKYNANGVQQWMVRYNGPGNGLDQAFSLAIDKNANVYVTGESTGSGTGLDFATIMYNANGVQQWVTRYNGPGNGEDGSSNFISHGIPKRIAVDASGSVYVTGPSAGSGTGMDYATIRYNATGVQQWVARYNGPSNGFDAAIALAVDDNSNVFVTGISQGVGTGNDFATVRYNSNGNQQWVTRYNGPVNNDDAARDIALDINGNIYVTGSSIRGFIQFEGEEFSITNYLTVKYNTAGVQQWEATYDGPVGQHIVSRPSALAVDGMGNVYVTGQSGFTTDEEDYATVKYDANGVQQWAARYTSTDFDHRAFAIALDGFDNVYVTGQSDLNYTTVKYNTNGVQQWVAKGSEDLSFGAVAHSIAVDALANVYVTGDPVTIKYSQPLAVCGTKEDKVMVCHKGKRTLCISKTDVLEHLRHGDKIGECPVEEAEPAITARQFFAPGNAQPDHIEVFCAPNPVSTHLKISYALPVNAHVCIKVYDMMGRQITTLVDAAKQAGIHNADLNVETIGNGMYYYHITVKSTNTTWSQTGKISVVK